MEDRIRITVSDHVADVKLIRGDKMNALDPAMFEQIAHAIDQLAQMPLVRCVVLSGEGRAFCAGLDMASMASGGSGNSLADRTHGLANVPQQAAWGWRTLPMPVIAAVHGVAFGGGFQIMSGADIRIAAPHTRFAIREVHWGLVPDMAGIALWRGLARDDVLRELTYTAREFDADEALGFGFVTKIAADPWAEAHALATQIAARNPQAVRGSKKLFNLQPDLDSASILQAESDVQLGIIRQPNQVEAVMANMQKRAAVFAD
ncbi:MAG: crotonase/enoyl-CoA hydratase family protein [Sphingomonas sp.]|nr:crotonase/enoyl-CoA hydratase family protein [Sphingomonas sp.]